MLILSTGDFHFCGGYDEDIVQSLRQIKAKAGEHAVDLITITGDVYERASDPEGRNPAAESIQFLAESAPVLIVKGNHDAPGDLRILEKLKTKNLVMVDELPNVRVFGRDAVAIHSLPWITKARWVKQNLEASTEQADATVSALALQYLKNAVQLITDVDQHILVGHLLISGARAQNHQRLIGEGVTFGQYDLPEAGFFAGILGHIHLQQVFDNPLFFYNGSVCALDYGETPEKYFSILDTKTAGVEWIRLKTIDRYTLNGEYLGIADGMTYDDPEYRARIPGARVRIIYTVPEGENAKAIDASLEKDFYTLGALEVKVNHQIIPKDAAIAVEIAKAQSSADKLKALWQAKGGPDEDTQRDMLEKLGQVEDELVSGNLI
jgi:exonuclease SbcD